MVPLVLGLVGDVAHPISCYLLSLRLINRDAHLSSVQNHSNAFLPISITYEQKVVSLALLDRRSKRLLSPR